MKSLICSDSHDQVSNFTMALVLADTAACDSVIFCGDLCSSFMLDVYHAKCPLPLHMVFGNNEGDKFHLLKKSEKLNIERDAWSRIRIHGEFIIAEKGHDLDGIPSDISLAVYHYPEMAKIIGLSGKFQVVCCGHTHVSSIEKINDTLLINPGSLMGYISGKKMEHVKPSCVIINWQTGEMELIEL